MKTVICQREELNSWEEELGEWSKDQSQGFPSSLSRCIYIMTSNENSNLSERRVGQLGGGAWRVE